MRFANPIRATAVTLLAAALLGLATGCPPPPPPPVKQPIVPTAQRIAEARQAYEQQAPGTLVGDVTAVMEHDGLVAVSDVSGQDFKAGDWVTFVDLEGHIVNHGHVINILPDSVHVRYTTQADADNSRAPRVGDLMVKLK